MTYRHIKLGYACEQYIQQANNSYLRRIKAQAPTVLITKLDATKSSPSKIGPAQSAPSSSHHHHQGRAGGLV